MSCGRCCLTDGLVAAYLKLAYVFCSLPGFGLKKKNDDDDDELAINDLKPSEGRLKVKINLKLLKFEKKTETENRDISDRIPPKRALTFYGITPVTPTQRMFPH